MERFTFNEIRKKTTNIGKLSFKELCDLKLSNLRTFHIRWIKKKSKSQRWALSSWGTNPWSNFYDPHWEVIYRNQWSRELRNIHITEITVGTHFHAQHGFKLPHYFYLLMEKPLGSYFQFRSPYYKGEQCNQKNLFFYLKDGWSGLRRPKKNKHLHQSKLTTAFISLSQSQLTQRFRFSSNQPNRKRQCAKLVYVIENL